MFVNPCLVIIWVCGDMDGGKLGDGVGCMPVAKGEFCRNGCFFGQLLQFGSTIMFSARYADCGGAYIAVSMLVVAPLCVVGIEEELDVN